MQFLEDFFAQKGAEVQDTVTAARQEFTENILVASLFDDDAKELLGVVGKLKVNNRRSK